MAASEVEEVSKRFIQAVETALDPSTVQQQRVKAYEVSFKWSPEDSLRNDAEYRCSKKMPVSKNNSSGARFSKVLVPLRARNQIFKSKNKE